MSFLGKLFGTEKALTATVKAARDGLDALVYTDEEKAADAAKDRTEARSMVVQWMAATQGQNLARRVISLSITAVWLIQYLASQLLITIALFVDKPEGLNSAAKVMREGAGDMESAVMLILAFYFAAPHMGDMAKAVMGKFSKSERVG